MAEEESHTQPESIEKLTHSYIRRLDAQIIFVIIIVLITTSVSFFWFSLQIGGSLTTGYLADDLYFLASFTGASLACITAYRARFGPLQLSTRYQLGWLLISLGLFADGIGGVFFARSEHMGYFNPIPSSADIGFTLFYPFIFLGLFFLVPMPFSKYLHINILLDSVITSLSIFGISWFFLIGPILTSQTTQYAPLPTLITTLSYPGWDILLIFAIVMLIQKRAEPVLYPSLLLFGIGILSIIWADSSYAYRTAIVTYNSGTFYIDPFWYIGAFLIGISALVQYRALTYKSLSQKELTHTLTSTSHFSYKQIGWGDSWFQFIYGLLIYVPFSTLILLTLYDEVVHNESIDFFLVILSCAVGVLITLRYLLVTRENNQLLREREQENQLLERLRHISLQLANIFDIDLLLEQIVKLAVDELSIEASTALLIEDHDHSYMTHSSIRVYSIAKSSQAISWRYENVLLKDCLFFMQREIEVNWDQGPFIGNLRIPDEINSWLQAWQLHKTFFVPLVYQDKVLGSLAISKSSAQPFQQNEKQMARLYMTHIAAFIEHAYLYQEGRKKEAFTSSLARIATRLNVAINDPVEIYNLICREAASAFQASDVLLYKPENTGELALLAQYPEKSQNTDTTGDWPSIHPNDMEAQFLSSLQPVLLQSSQLYHPKNGELNQSSVHAQSLLRQKLIQHYIHSTIFAPLLAWGEPIGLLILARSYPPGNQEQKSFVITNLALIQDFSEQAAVAFSNAQLYEQQLMTHKRLQELDQLKDQFMITASHELRTPLTAVQGYLELLNQYGDILPAEQRREFLRKAQRSCDELVIMLSNVMDASRLEIEAGIQSAHLEPVHIQRVLEHVMAIIEPQVTQEHREVILDIPANLGVKADPVRLRQVLLNISVNAMKYSPVRTPIAIRARALDSTSCVISITDKGNGISKEDQARLFQRFTRLEADINSAVRGTGLGLYISRQLIQAMHGKIWIESTGIPGEGASFHIQLPLAQPAENGDRENKSTHSK